MSLGRGWEPVPQQEESDDHDARQPAAQLRRPDAARNADSAGLMWDQRPGIGLSLVDETPSRDYITSRGYIIVTFRATKHSVEANTWTGRTRASSLDRPFSHRRKPAAASSRSQKNVW